MWTKEKKEQNLYLIELHAAASAPPPPRPTAYNYFVPSYATEGQGFGRNQRSSSMHRS